MGRGEGERGRGATMTDGACAAGSRVAAGTGLEVHLRFWMVGVAELYGFKLFSAAIATTLYPENNLPS